MPRPRYMHSMDLLESKANIFDTKVFCTILGGITEDESILNDFWLLDMGTLEWCEVSLSYSNCNKIAG